MKRLLMKIKLRGFTEDDLLAALDMIDRADRDKLNNEKTWKNSQMARFLIAGELVRRGVVFW
jgi:hypothetical protein